jgi:hypothetical protein
LRQHIGQLAPQHSSQRPWQQAQQSSAVTGPSSAPATLAEERCGEQQDVPLTTSTG